MNELRTGSKVTLKSDKGVFTIISTMQQEDGLMYEVTNGIQTFWTNRANFSDKPKVEQLCLFDFADEIASMRPAVEEARAYKAGATFSNEEVTVRLIKDKEDEPNDLSIEVTKGKYRFTINESVFDPWKKEYVPFTNETIIAFYCMGFEFYILEDGEWRDFNGDHWTHIEWLEDPEINAMVDEAFKDAWKGNDQISISYDFRDLFVMKWLGMEKLPNRYMERVVRGMRPMYYNISVPFGEFLRFLHMKEVQA